MKSNSASYTRLTLTCPLRCDEVKVLDVLSEGLDVLVDGVRRHTPDLDEPIVLDEDGVAGEIAVYDGLLGESHLQMSG